MKLSAPLCLNDESNPVIDEELNVIRKLLNTEGTRILELGCGAAYQTRAIIENTRVRSIVAAEVDQRQHQKNLQVTDLPSVTFKSYGAESIEEADRSFDAVIMLKSLHHVPLAQMQAAFREIHRVLVDDGYLYISEPVFAGDFNAVLSLFHNEERVRQSAFDAILNAVKNNLFESVTQYFFSNRIKFKSFQQFEQGVLNTTHTEHNLSSELMDEVKQKFLGFESPEGYVFCQPNRVNLLKKVNHSG